MATTTKSWTESLYDSSIGLKSTWTFTATMSDTAAVTASGSKFVAPLPTITAKYVGTGKKYAKTQMYVYVGWTSGNSGQAIADYYSSTANYPAWTSGVTKTLSHGSVSEISTSSYFNSSNRNSITATMDYGFGEPWDTWSAKNTSEDEWNSLYFSSFTPFRIGSATITLDAPPNLSELTVTSTSRDGIYWTEDSAGVANSSIKISGIKMQYSAYCSEYTLTIGDFSYTNRDVKYSSFSSTIPLVGIPAGTYTPTFTATDTRGQTTTVQLPQITLQQYVRSTYDITQAQSNTGSNYFANKSSASVTISNISVPTGYVLEEVRLTIGNDTITQPLDGTESTITVSVPLTETGTFTPDVYIKDSRGLGEHNALNPITVLSYAQPTATVDAQRVTSLARPTIDDEGTNVLLTANISFSDGATIKEPEATIGSDTASIVWYETYDVSDPTDPNYGLSDAIDWNTYSPTSPVTIYGFSDGYGSTTGYGIQDSFQIALTVEDVTSTAAQVMVTVPQAFFTVDFLAGGHGVAFGQLATQTGFWCDMDTHLLQGVDVDGDVNVTDDVYIRNATYKVPVIFIENTAPTSADGENGDIWLQYT